MENAQDYWDFYFGRVDGKPSSCFVNLSLGERAPVQGHTDCVYVSVKMKSPKPSGLSSQEEFDPLAALEDDLSKVIDAQSGIFAGRVTHDGMRDFFAYFRDGGAAKTALLDFQQAHSNYAMEIGARTDLEWEVYRGYLYPAPSAFQQIRNRAQLMQLQAAGDRLDQRRRIDHYATFPDAPTAGQFAEAASAEGFLLDSIKEQDGATQLRFWREDAPHGIDLVTDMIVGALDGAVGRYDGWECEMVKL
ncbi:DUF695 domain-containing protein [Alisedimentitalea sp. MJ-SS2]|uniref:DUF695 domain-containing protein n=1 Tax=Aliisedimentitalea sp. MJ-SS2 TaxID=3049795 RepID=UPI00290B5773|nr:DUF695 domain-containing protein [Alisedimentitalea sp. MJ-SS2]MDU8926492.1 DUF695 domain-containing protein [Alisedimentitalea sp. MJ-SS2]